MMCIFGRSLINAAWRRATRSGCELLRRLKEGQSRFRMSDDAAPLRAPNLRALRLLPPAVAGRSLAGTVNRAEPPAHSDNLLLPGLSLIVVSGTGSRSGSGAGSSALGGGGVG